MSVITGQMPTALRPAQPADARPATTRARQRQRAGAVGVLLRPRRHRHQPRQHHRDVVGQQLELLGAGQRERRRPQLERDGAEADPGRRRRHRHRAATSRRVEALKWMAAYHPDASYYVPAHLERAGPFNPDGNNGYNVEHLRDFNNAAPKIAFGFETPARPRRLEQPRRVSGHAQQHRRRPRRLRRRHDLRRHRRLRRPDRRRVGRAARRRPQLVVLRQLRLAQPRQLRSRRSPLDAGLLPGRVPAHVRRLVRNGSRQAAPADDRRRPAQRQQLRRERPAHRPPRVRRLHVGNDATRVGRGAGARGSDAATPTSTSTAARRWARSSWCSPARTSSSRSRCAIPRARTTRRTRSRTRRCAGRHQPADQHAGARPHRRDPRSGHRLQDSRAAPDYAGEWPRNSLAARRRHDGRPVGRAGGGEEHHARRVLKTFNGAGTPGRR